MLDFPTTSNIVVLASYRTGSSVFCDIIAMKYTFKNIHEVFHPSNPRDYYDKFQNYLCVIKIMPDHFYHPKVASVIKNSYVIGISRKNVCAQIASFYISSTNRVWQYFRGQTTDQYTIPIDRPKLQHAFNYITKINSEYRKLADQHCKQEFYYEDIQQEFQNSDIVCYPKPSNYKEIYMAVADFLK